MAELESDLLSATLAIDFGHLSTIVAISPHAETGTCVLVRNTDMNVETPSCVAFTPEKRLFGLTAKHGARSRENTAFSQLPLLLCSDAAAPGTITMRGTEQTFSADQLVAMFIAHVKTFSTDFAEARKWNIQNVVFALPDSIETVARARILSAASMAGWSSASAISSIDALAAAFARKSGGAEAQHFCVVDCGSLQMSAVIGRADAVAAAEGAAAADCATSGAFNILARHASAGASALSGERLSALLFEHFAAIFESKRGGKKLSARLTARLRERCQKLREQLSAGNRASLVLDGVEPPIAPIAFSRSDFEALCAPAKETLVGALRALLAESGLAAADVASVVLVGGVTRTPWVQAAVAAVFERDVGALRYTLDVSYAVATGAAQLVARSAAATATAATATAAAAAAAAAGGAPTLPSADAAPAESAAPERCATGVAEGAAAAFATLETTLRAADAEATRAAELRYKLDSYVVSVRDECNDGALAALLPTETIAPLLDEAEEWAYEPRSAAQCEEKVRMLRRPPSSASTVAAAVAVFLCLCCVPLIPALAPAHTFHLHRIGGTSRCKARHARVLRRARIWSRHRGHRHRLLSVFNRIVTLSHPIDASTGIFFLPRWPRGVDWAQRQTVLVQQ